MKKVICAVVLTVLLVGGMVFLGEKMHPQTVLLKTQVLRAKPTAQTVVCKGRVEATQEITVMPPVDCIVKETVAQNGDTVKKGDVLFYIDKQATLAVLATADGALAAKTAMQDDVADAVTATADGVLTDYTAVSGAALTAAKSCAVIAAHEPVQIRISIPERHIARVKVGQAVSVSGVGFSKQRYAGVVQEIDTVAKQEANGGGTQTVVEAVIRIQDGEADDSLRVGLTADAAITVSTVDAGFLLPYDAVQADDDNREFVYILDGEAAKKRTFTPIAEMQDGYLVAEGFQNGERLILQPNEVAEKGIYAAKEDADA